MLINERDLKTILFILCFKIYLLQYILHSNIYANDEKKLCKIRKFSSQVRDENLAVPALKWQVTTAVRNMTDCRVSSALVTGASRSARYNPGLSWYTLHLVGTTLYSRTLLPTYSRYRPAAVNIYTAIVPESNADNSV